MLKSYFPLKGERIYLREVRQSDVNEIYYGWLNDSAVNAYLETKYLPRSLENIVNYVKKMDGKLDEPFFAICLLENNQHIGNIKIGPINWYHRLADISLFIGEKSLWGKGYASETIKVITEFAFRILNLNKLEAGCYHLNEASAKAFEKCGYQREGLLRGHFIYNGQEVNVIKLGYRSADFWKEYEK